jgi:serine/threonine protein kinase
MSLAAGTRLGAYEIVSAIGTGGMGEVYRATDTKLKRQVAIKVLPESFANDPERLARFQREAEVLASLNHPNIAAVYGLEQTDDVQALVMELVEGPTLADRIAQGAIPVDEALPIAKQIAEALEAAHERGIIHRDLKPANIKLRPDGTVKVLDFGLAKLAEAPGATAANPAGLSMSPTITSPAMMTGVGMLLGTAAYMSPEQAKGKAADKRSDIWAFGCVLYEMLTGKRAFEGEDVSDTLANVLKTQPDWIALPADVPPTVTALLQRCLEKDSRRRVRDVSAAVFALNESVIDAVRSSLPRHRIPFIARHQVISAVLGLLAASAAIVFAALALSRRAPALALEPVSLTSEVGTDVTLVTEQGPAAALSPDGSVLVFVARRGTSSPQLYVRPLNQLQATPLPGTEGAHDPFFSPDGRWIGFFTTSFAPNALSGSLKKIPVRGGNVTTICDALIGRGASWQEDGTIVFAPNTAPGTTLMRVSSNGGEPEPLTSLGPSELVQRWPHVLPDGRGIIYSATGIGGDWSDASIVLRPSPEGPSRVLAKGIDGRYVPSGHLVFIRDGTLFAAPFDLQRLELTGQPAPLVEGIETNNYNGIVQYAIAESGTLVYLPSRIEQTTKPILWADRNKKIIPLRSTAANRGTIAFAPDGQRLALDVSDGKQRDLWVYEWARDILTRVTTDDVDDQNPVWSPDGRRIVYASKRSDKVTPHLNWRLADGTGPIERLTNDPYVEYPFSWHPSGKFLAYTVLNPQTTQDIMILPLQGDEVSGWKPGKPMVFLNSPGNDGDPQFSPDGRWIAYVGSAEVYVRPFPGPGGQWQVSNNGGGVPVWSKAGHELFYGSRDGQIMVVPYSVEGDSFRPERPKPWSDAHYALEVPTARLRHFDLHPDGKRFAVAPVVESASAQTQNKAVFIFNFFDELRRSAPVGNK